MIQVGTPVQYRPLEGLGSAECRDSAQTIDEWRPFFRVPENGKPVPAIVLDNDFPNGMVTLIAFDCAGNKVVFKAKEGTTPGTFCLIPVKVAGDRTIAGQGFIDS